MENEKTTISQSHSWSDEEYLTRAKKEPERLAFWMQYEESVLEASKSVCDNPPTFDVSFKRVFPNPKSYRNLQKAEYAYAAFLAVVTSPEFKEMYTKKLLTHA